jgi:hypothetical protein
MRLSQKGKGRNRNIQVLGKAENLATHHRLSLEGSRSPRGTCEQALLVSTAFALRDKDQAPTEGSCRPRAPGIFEWLGQQLDS